MISHFSILFKVFYRPTNIVRILAPTDAIFEEFLAILDRSQGDSLRRFSRAVSPIVESVLQGRVEESEVFPIEHVQKEKILELPKGSDALLHLIS
jgi:hypothetical protein